MKPLKISAWPSSAIVADLTLPLDGILLSLAMQAAYGPEDATLPGELTKPLVDIPIEKRDVGKLPYYACSFAQWHGVVAEGTSHWTKAPKVEFERFIDFGKKKPHIETAKGRDKAYHMPVYTLHSNRIDWYAVGNAGEIRELLATCFHIGKKRGQGWGAVEWHVEEWHEDWSVVRDGHLMRAVPAPQLPAGVAHTFSMLHCGYYPPYWLHEHQTLCAVPSVTLPNSS